MQSHFFATGLALSLLAACQFAPTSSGVFLDPASFEGKPVKVCGWLTDAANIMWKRSGIEFGLSVYRNENSPNLKAFIGNRICLSGKVRYVGCGTDKEKICTDAAYDYAITPTRVE